MTAEGEIIEQACEALCAALRAAVPELKHAAPTYEVPDVPVEYPSIAVLIESMTDVYGADIEMEDEDGDPIMFDGSSALMEVGTTSVSPRLFLAARTPGERAKLGGKIKRAFADDDIASGRLLVTITNIAIDGQATPATYPIAFFLDGEDWSDEMAWSEKRWTYLRLQVDVPILVLRKDATPVTSAQVTVAASTTMDLTPLTSPDQIADLDPADTLTVTINADGTVGPTP